MALFARLKPICCPPVAPVPHRIITYPIIFLLFDLRCNSYLRLKYRTTLIVNLKKPTTSLQLT